MRTDAMFQRRELRCPGLLCSN